MCTANTSQMQWSNLLYDTELMINHLYITYIEFQVDETLYRDNDI